MFDKVTIGQVLSGEVTPTTVDTYLDNLKKAQELAVDVKEVTELRSQLLDYVDKINTVLNVVRTVSSAALNVSDIEGAKSLIDRLRDEFPEQIVTSFIGVEVVDADKPYDHQDMVDEVEAVKEVAKEYPKGIPVITLNLSETDGKSSEKVREAITSLLKQGNVPLFGHAGGIVRGPGARRVM